MPASMPPVSIGNDEIIDLRKRCYPIIDQKETNPEFKELGWTSTATEFGKAMQRYFDYPPEKRIPLAQYETGQKLVEWYPGVTNPYPKPDFPSAHPNPLIGLLEVGRDGFFTKANGPVYPLGVHFGDGFLCQTEGRDIEPQLASFREVGAHFTRQWMTLQYYKQGNFSDFWGNRGCSPKVTPNYWGELARNIEMHIDYELKLHLSMGDLNNVPTNEVNALYDGLADLIAKYGAEHFIFPGEVNEALATFSNPPSGETLANYVNRIRVRHPQILYAVTGGGGYVPPNILKEYTPSFMNAYYKHGYRDGHYWDKLRHYFSDGYEYYGKLLREYGADHEPMGFGKYVSATENREEINDSLMGLVAVAACIAKQSFVYFCSAGIKWEDQDFNAMAGYATVFKLVNMLPAITQGTLHHSGDRWSNLSVFRAVNEFRVDGIIDGAGNFNYVAYGPGDRIKLPVSRSFDGRIINPKTLEVHSISANRGEFLPEMVYDKGFVITGKVRG